MSKKEKINRSIQFRNGSYSSILTIIVIAIVIVINLAVAQLPASITTFETSGVDYYSISDSTKNMLKNLPTDVNIYLLSNSSGGYEEYIETMCGIFKDSSDKVSLRKVDVAVEPDFVTKYNANSASGNSVIVEEPVSGKYKLIDYQYDIYYSTTSYDENGIPYYTYYYDGEGKLASAINYVTSDKTFNIYEIGGHGEPALSSYGIDSEFEKSNYFVKDTPLNLTSDSAIPEDCDVLFIMTPMSDYTSSEAEAVKNYISNGGYTIIVHNNVVAYTGISDSDFANFKSILSYIGVTVTDGLVYEQDDNYYYSAVQEQYAKYALLPRKNTSSSFFSGIESSYIFTAYASPVKKSESTYCTSTYTELLSTSSNYQIVYFDDQYTVDYTEPVSIATYVESDFSGSGEKAKTLVIGCGVFFENMANDETLINNNIKLVNNAIKEMVGDTSSVYIEPKLLKETFNVTTKSQVNLYSIVYLGLIPLLFLVVGISVWILRRAK